MMTVLAERSKHYKLDAFFFCLGVLGIFLFFFVDLFTIYKIFLFIASVLLLWGGVYDFLLPKTAIAKKDDELFFFFAFRCKKVRVSEVQYVSVEELGSWTNRNSLFAHLHRAATDSRTIVVTVKEGDALKHLKLFLPQATATALTLNIMIDDYKKNVPKE